MWWSRFHRVKESIPRNNFQTCKFQEVKETIPRYPESIFRFCIHNMPTSLDTYTFNLTQNDKENPKSKPSHKGNSDSGMPHFWNHAGMWNISYNTGRTSSWVARCFNRGKSTCKIWLSSECAPMKETQGIPFKGCSKKLKGLLSIMTVRRRSRARRDKSLTCSRYFY